MRQASAARFYELMVITAPDGTPEELLETVDQINGYITSAGGSILRSSSDSPWGRRRLAYPIRYQSADVRDGFYTLIHMEIGPDKVIEIERDLKLNDRLLRYLVLQLAGEPVFPEPVEEEPTANQSAEGETTVTEAADNGDTTEATAEERREIVAAAEAVPEVIEVDAVAEEAGVTEEEPDVAE